MSIHVSAATVIGLMTQNQKQKKMKERLSKN